MPPLLLEYLREPIQVTIAQSNGSGLASLATMFGGVFAALLGAYAAYFFGNKSERRKLKQEKLEEVYAVTDKLKKSVAVFADDFASTVKYSEGESVSVLRFPDSAKAQDMQAISNKLAFLVQVHLSKKEALIEKLIGQLDQLYIDTNLHASSGFENRASATKYFQFLGSLVSSISVTLNTIAKAAVAEAKRLS